MTAATLVFPQRSSRALELVHGSPSPVIAVVWAQLGPYHFARLRALAKAAAPARVIAIELSNQSRDYAWRRPADPPVEPVTLFTDRPAEALGWWPVFRRLRATLRAHGVSVCLLPSYWPASSMGAFLAASSLRVRTVMMNESHAGTGTVRGWRSWVKRRMVDRFDAALVGGAPHRRYFTSLGLPAHCVHVGYDAVDNDYFSARADQARLRASALRNALGLPARYILSLGRFVPKKNLQTLLRAYCQYLDGALADPSAGPPAEGAAVPGSGARCEVAGLPHLVLVGAGPEEPAMKSLCKELGLPVHEQPDGLSQRPVASPQTPAVHFFGFRQLEESPVFYALAEVFVLPSLHEEWGLVVNEAMACGLPVVVSRTAGCAEDLLDRWPQEVPLSPALDPLRANVRRNGFVFDPGAVKQLEAVLRALCRDSELRARMGRESRRTIRRFSCERFARGALAAVRAALARPSPVRSRR